MKHIIAIPDLRWKKPITLGLMTTTCNKHDFRFLCLLLLMLMMLLLQRGGRFRMHSVLLSTIKWCPISNRNNPSGKNELNCCLPAPLPPQRIPSTSRTNRNSAKFVQYGSAILDMPLITDITPVNIYKIYKKNKEYITLSFKNNFMKHWWRF